MNSVRRALLACVSAASLMIGTSDAATNTASKGVPRHQAKPTPTDVLVNVLFQNKYEQGENLATACRRASFKNLAIALNMNRELLTSKKGEFETSAQFEERAGKIAEILSTDPVLFCEALNENPDVTFDYDADNQRFKGGFQEHHNVWRDVKQLGSYKTRTQMGIAATVKASAEFEYNVSLTLPSNLRGCLASQYSSYKFQAPYSLGDAPSLKVAGRIVFLVKLVPPYVGEEEREGHPTLDNPYDVYRNIITVYAEPEKLIIIDATGKEVWACRVGALIPLQPPTPLGEEELWFTFSDVPFEARYHRKGFLSGIQENVIGSVSAVLQVGADGSVAGCTITSSSGRPDVDHVACTAWVRRGKFLPASDKDGNPTTSEYAVTKTLP